MKFKASQIKAVDDRYGYSSPIDQVASKRLDLNDLLKRSADEKNKRKKVNFIIFSATTFLILLFFFLLSF